MPSRFQMREGWFALALLFLILFFTTLTLEAANWAPGLHILFSVLLASFALGLLFAKSRLSGLLLHPLALVLGASWITVAALGLAEVKGPWDDKLAELIVRLIWWQRDLVSGQVITETLPFVLLMAALVWGLAYVGTWSFFRERNIWGVLIPCGITMLVNTYYSNSDLTLLLLLWLIMAFLLVIRSNLLEQEARWQQNEISYSNDIQFDFLREGAIFAVAIVALAWMLPNAVSTADTNPLLTRISRPWGRAQQEWNRLFSSLNYRGTAASGAWFGTSMSFRGPLVRTNRLVMNVRATQGRYWRAIVLDDYTSAGWVVTDRRVADVPLDTVARTAAVPEGRVEVEQRFTIFAPAGTLLFMAGQPLRVSTDSQVLLGGPGAEAAEPTAEAITQVLAKKVLYQGESYTAVSAIPVVDQRSLREAGTAYPAGLREHYTRLPSTVPQRVRDLAVEVTAGGTTPLDQAQALESYLRTFPYNEAIPGPTPGEDGVEYFLFRERQGYCDYYASAMAVMLRSLGVPARIAQGYTQGTLLESGEYEVRQINAHTWVEVYFPDHGWVEFEPTAAEPLLDRPQVSGEDAEAEPTPGATDSSAADLLAEQEALRLEREAAAAAAQQAAQESAANGGFRLQIDPRVILVPLGILGVAGLVGAAGWGLTRRRWQGLGPIERLYDQVGLAGRALGQRLDPTLTPTEYAERLGEQVPPVRGPLARLAALFSKQRFSPRPLDAEELDEARQSWHSIRRPLGRAALLRLAPRRRAPEEEQSAKRKAHKGKRRR